MTNAHPITHADVAHAIRRACHPGRERMAAWQRSLVDDEPNQACAFCLSELSTPGNPPLNSLLVHPFLGARAIAPNRIRVCRSCARFRDNRDVLSWPRFQHLGTPDSRARILELREQVLIASANHLTPTRANAPKRLVLAALRKRWEHPRIRVFAYQGHGGAYVGWTPRCGGKAALGEVAAILRFGFQATPTPDRRLSLFQVPGDLFLDAVWELIEHGALVEQLTLPGALPPDHEDWRAWWPVVFTSVHDLARRRPRLAGNSSRVPGTIAHAAKVARAALKAAGVPDQDMPELVSTQSLPQAPRKPRTLSQTASAIRKRERYRAEVSLQREREWLAARAALDDFKKRVRDGLVERPSIEEELAMERQVMDLQDQMYRWRHQG